VLREWYLFPETLPGALSPSGYATVNDYVDALTATARSQGRDRFFTFVTSIAEENAFFSSGASAGFGVRLSIDSAARRLFISEAFENAPALAAGIDRGTEILAIGTTVANLRTVSDILIAEGSAGITNALGPSTAGTTRVLRVTDAGGTRDLTVTKANFDIVPVSSRYGARVISDGGRQVAYLNLRTFISTADAQLRSAIDQFRAQGITNFVVDLRYNGGGLVSTAELMGDLLGGNRLTSEVFSVTTFRPEKSSNNETKRYAPQPQSASPVKIAFITTSASASASELVINSMIPYYGTNLALIGGNTFGKPVGQIAVDRTACDDRMRVVAFSTQNSVNGGFYYSGLASNVRVSCQAADDITRPLGDASEASLRQALNFIGGVACTPISSSGQTSQALRAGERRMLTPDAPSAAQREVPGLY
jgi:C-terminal processing protease CtpA/Prc